MDGYVQIGTKLDTKNFDAQIEEVEYELKQIEFELSKKKELKLDSRTIMEYEQKAEKLNNQLIDLRKKQADLNKTDLSKIQNSIENIGKSTGKTIKRLGKWALGIFAIESAYGFVRQAMSSITQYNEQIETDVEYIRFSLASMLQPVIETLINLVYKLLTYINYVAQQWFGINLFANSSADAFNKANKNAKKLQKTMAGFDEMNIISDSSSSSSQGNMLPSFDLSKNQIEIPDWLKNITSALEGIVKFGAEHPELIIGILGGAKLVSWLASIIGTAGVAGGVGATGLLGIASILIIIAGINISNVVKEIANLSDKFGNNAKTFKDNAKNAEELAEKFEDAGISAEKYNDIAKTLAGTSLNTAEGFAIKATEIGFLGNSIGNYMEQLENLIKQEESYAAIMESAYNNTEKNAEQTRLYVEYLKSYRDGLLNINTTLQSNAATAYLYSNTIKNNVDKVGQLNDKISLLEGNLGNTSAEFNQLSQKAGISNGILETVKKTLDTIKSKKVTLDVDANTTKAEISFKNLFNNNLSKGINNIFSSFGWNIKLPKLAVGGIVNMPGRGINYGGANIGERGAEGVIPLTNSQMMAELGQAIGRYVNINATVPVYVGNRQIAREIKKINADNDFASNG
ncbi:MAG: hypothetical protein IJ371_06490 [Clostridia bacterium]|nr:hypothetical protein [Clostridia bacterium]MBQ8425765.1 hypothetical protein [Clostridia bacterium]